MILDNLTQDLSWTSDLEVVPDISHAALHKRLSGLFLQCGPSHVQSVDIRQVINAAYIDPVPGANLHTKTSRGVLRMTKAKRQTSPRDTDTFNKRKAAASPQWMHVVAEMWWTQTIGPSLFCPAFFMCCLTSWRPLFLPILLAIHSVRWNPVSPEMAMWRLIVSMKRTLEPFREEVTVLFWSLHT